jgi:hypothetical protein
VFVTQTLFYNFLVGSPMVEREAPKEKDIGQITRYLTSTFNQVISKLERASRPTKGTSWQGTPNQAYLITRDFAYLLNELVQGPRCMVQKHITDCNNFLDELMQSMNAIG